MRIEWFNISKEYWENKQDEILKGIDTFSWFSIPCSLPMAQGMSIKSLIKEFKIPKVKVVGYSNFMAPFSVIGCKGEYKNGNFNIFAVDDGCSITPLFSLEVL